MSLRNGDEVITIGVRPPHEENHIIYVSERGKSRPCSMIAYGKKDLGGLGLNVAKVTKNTGDLVNALFNYEDVTR